VRFFPARVLWAVLLAVVFAATRNAGAGAAPQITPTPNAPVAQPPISRPYEEVRREKEEAARRSGPSAGPVETPSRVDAPSFTFALAPPLSPEEAKTLLMAGIDILRIRDAATSAARCRKVIQIIGSVSDYLTLLDRRTSSLSSYKWYFIDREKVDPGMDTDEYIAQPPIAKVSAISFAADYADVVVYWAVVQDGQGNATTFPLQRVVEPNYPQRVVCYLFFPTAVKKVTLRYRPRVAGTRDPHLTVFAGVAREPEYLKQALWYLRSARAEASQATRDASGSSPHLALAAQNLRSAAKCVTDFQRTRRY
jgi:hypothetical protein